MTSIQLNLIWPDDVEMMLLMQYSCRQRGYTLYRFISFADVQAQWHHQLPTVAIIKRSIDTIDDGLAFCRTIRADPQLQHIPIIVGWADIPKQPFEESYEAGANGCFGRVFDLDGIFAMIERLAQNPAQTNLVDQSVPHQHRSTHG